ncbi:hypothetical protein NDU88_003700 [Pleurodeles waltl]|uniref:Uncharacterized protein n=1 Tax=Pleurodeles waltl TaxID=8319 RepID=A0AAV7KXQ2_PLEWA|nr:hypothetical protein NDU88_003700 [Pleurodeles waltl]
MHKSPHRTVEAGQPLAAATATGGKWAQQQPVHTLARLSTHTPDTHPEHHKTPPDTPHNPLQRNQDQKTESTRARQRTPADRTRIVTHTRSPKPRSQSRCHSPPSPCPPEKSLLHRKGAKDHGGRDPKSGATNIRLRGAAHTHCTENGAVADHCEQGECGGDQPRTRDDIRKRWNDLQGKVRAMASRHHNAVQKTGGGLPPTPPDYTDWEEKVLAILHPEGLTGGPTQLLKVELYQLVPGIDIFPFLSLQHHSPHLSEVTDQDL